MYFPDDPNSFSLSSSQIPFKMSSFDSVGEEVLEVKTMLLQLRRVLEQVRLLKILQGGE
jgi:hypothetical protein